MNSYNSLPTLPAKKFFGHQKQWELLRQSVKVGKIPQAFLFSGQSQLGKKTVAIEFAKLLNCQEERFDAKPCQNCQNCKNIEKKTHPDFILIEPETKTIPIERIRELSRKFSFKTSSAFFKTAIIDRAHLMTVEAQTSLLKTLEEPKGTACFILISEYPESLLPTVLSRCERIKFFPLSQKEIERFLLNKGISAKEAGEVSNFSFGKPGRAVNLIEDNLKFKKEEEETIAIEKLINSNFSSRFQYAKNASQDSDKLNEILELWLRYFRKILIAKLEGKSSFEHYSLVKVKNVLETVQKIIFLNSTTNINPKLALELLMLEL
jgi:DNA polymerase-3 subunit delta'